MDTRLMSVAWHEKDVVNGRTDALFLGPQDGAQATSPPVLVLDVERLSAAAATEHTDSHIQPFVVGGFQLQSPKTLRLPLLDGWLIIVDEARRLFALVYPNGFPTYTVDVDRIPPQWLAALNDSGRCVVMVGASLELDPVTFSVGDLKTAASRGSVAGAVIRLRPASA